MTRTAVDPRVARTRDLVLSAAADVLVDEGFERVCIDAIAERSGVARSTIYRNWPSRAQLLIEAFELLAEKPEPGDGSLRDELLRMACFLAEGLDGQTWGRALPSLIGAAAYDDELRERLSQFSAQRRRECMQLVEAAAARGEIPAPDDPATPLLRFVGAFFFRRLVAQQPIDQAFVDAQVEATARELGAP